MRKLLPFLFAARLFAAASPAGNGYLLHNLVSDQPGVADYTDKNLVNAWGVDASATGSFWVNDGGTGLSTLYNTAGVVSATVVAVPATPKGPATSVATGIVFNGTGGFAVQPGRVPSFIFCTADGAVSGWSSAADATHGLLMIDNSATNAVYYGMAISGRTASATPLLYVANFRSGAIEVYDTNWKATTVPGGFTDATVPAGYAPFNIQNIGGKLYVTYAKQSPSKGGWVNGAGLGQVAVFDLNGNLITHLVSGGPLNAPCGVAIASANFGAFSGAPLVGNFGDGTINAFDPGTGNYMGTLADPRAIRSRSPACGRCTSVTAAAVATPTRCTSPPAALRRTTATSAACRRRRWSRPTPSATPPMCRAAASRRTRSSASSAPTSRR